MLSCEPESHQQAASSALLAAAFDAFPDKDYCLLTLPADSPELPLLAIFTRLLPPPGSALVEVLYLCHRFALLDGLQVGSHCPFPCGRSIMQVCSVFYVPYKCRVCPALGNQTALL